MENIRLISVNQDGVELDRIFTIKELEKDFWNDCVYVPSNDDEVKLVEIDGVNVTDSIERVNPYSINTLTFWDVTEYLGW
jgi:hypothetical protein